MGDAENRRLRFLHGMQKASRYTSCNRNEMLYFCRLPDESCHKSGGHCSLGDEAARWFIGSFIVELVHVKTRHRRALLEQKPAEDPPSKGGPVTWFQVVVARSCEKKGANFLWSWDGEGCCGKAFVVSGVLLGSVTRRKKTLVMWETFQGARINFFLCSVGNRCIRVWLQLLSCCGIWHDDKLVLVLLENVNTVFWLTWTMWIYVMNSVGRVSVSGKKTLTLRFSRTL